MDMSHRRRRSRPEQHFELQHVAFPQRRPQTRQLDPDMRRRKVQRFLVKNVPPIPVPDCDSPNCQCSYIRYKDRRLWTEDRRARFSRNADVYRQGDRKDRRRVEDRRVSADSRARSFDADLDDFESWYK